MQDPCAHRPAPGRFPAGSSGGPPDGPSGPGTPRRGSRALLLLGTPREVLARIVPADPLALRARVARGLRRRAVFADGDRVLLRVFALVAGAASGWRGRPTLSAWLDERVEDALDQILAEDDSSGEAPSARSVFALLAGPLQLDPDAVRAGCTRFNRLPPEERAAFFELAVEGAPLESVSRERGVAAPVLARRARRALDVTLRSLPQLPLPPPTP